MTENPRESQEIVDPSGGGRAIKGKDRIPRLDTLVTSSEETRMSQSAILWRMAEMGAIILMKTWCEGVRPKQQTPNWYVLFHHEAKITTRIVMRGSCM